MIPWKLVVILVVAVLLALFIGFNLDNKCEISYVFGKVESVPVYMTVLISFAAGLVAALPFSFRRRRKKAAANAPALEGSAKGDVKDAAPENASEAAGGGPVAEEAGPAKRGKRAKANDGSAARK